MGIEVWLEDKETGIQIGTNAGGELFLGNNNSGYNLHDTPENREYIINDFCRYTGHKRPVLDASGRPLKFEGSLVEFSR